MASVGILAAPVADDRSSDSSSIVEPYEKKFNGANGELSRFSLTAVPREQDPSGLAVTFTARGFSNGEHAPFSRARGMSEDAYAVLVQRLESCDACAADPDLEYGREAGRQFEQLFAEAAFAVDIGDYLEGSRLGRFK